MQKLKKKELIVKTWLEQLIFNKNDKNNVTRVLMLYLNLFLSLSLSLAIFKYLISI
jgi:hypothetical protein